MNQKRVTKVTILGSTGSIGTSTLDVIRRNRERFQIRALSARSNIEKLALQIREFEPDLVAVPDAECAKSLLEKCRMSSPARFSGRRGSAFHLLGMTGMVTLSTRPRALREKLSFHKTEILASSSSLVELASDGETDLVVSALSGSVGFLPALQAVRAGKDIALANKEALVMGGELILSEAKKSGSRIYPLDSEHNALYQLLQWAPSPSQVDRIYLTASGGPFLTLPLEKLSTITPEMALRHPTWSMGKKISIDSATMMNKGLELIEARWLFDLPPSQIGVAIHPQSLLHGALRLQDGSLLAMLSPTDMRMAISNILSPDATASALNIPPLELSELGRLDFIPLDRNRFPAFALAERALQIGGTSTTVLNSANEVAVAAFLHSRIPFQKIPALVEAALSAHATTAADTTDRILEADRWARSFAEAMI